MSDTATRNDLKDMKAILDRADIKYTETEGEIAGTSVDTMTLRVAGHSGTYFKFLLDDDAGASVRLVEYGMTEQ
jgi:hypothetical protein